MSYYQKYLDNYSRGYIGYNTLGILFQSCLGSVAAMLVLQNGVSPAQMIQLFFVTIFCMCFNGAVLSQQKPKIVFNMLIATILVSVIISIINIFII
jgi:hypothetical protein